MWRSAKAQTEHRNIRTTRNRNIREGSKIGDYQRVIFNIKAEGERLRLRARIARSRSEKREMNVQYHGKKRRASALGDI